MCAELQIVRESAVQLSAQLGELLLQHHMQLACAESCTGGSIAQVITMRPGCSAYFKGGVVAYTNEVKERLLGVSHQDLRLFGAVSSQVVRQMALGVASVCNTECAVATSGIAGPTGGSAAQPIGTVWIAVKCEERVVTKSFFFASDRGITMLKATNSALEMLIKLISEKKGLVE